MLVVLRPQKIQAISYELRESRLAHGKRGLRVEKGRHVQVAKRKHHMLVDLPAEVRVVRKSLQVQTEHFRKRRYGKQFSGVDLLLAFLALSHPN